MKIRKLAASAVLAFMAAGSAGAAELNFANFMAPTNPYEAGAFQPFAAMVAEMTGGEVTVRVRSGGELGAGPVEQYNRALDGVADLAIGLPGYTASTFPITLLSELPGVLTEDTGTETLWNNIDLFADEYRRVELIGLWSNAENVLYMRGDAVRTPADIAGKKIRVPSRNAGLIVESWGGSPVSMPVSEIYNALQTGVIDGAMIDGTATDAFKLGEVADSLTFGMNTTISPFFIVMNRDSFDALTPEQQTAIKEAGRQASRLANTTQIDAGRAGIIGFGNLEGKELIELTADEAKAFDDLSASVLAQVVDESTAAGLPAQDVIDALMAQ
ncbi:TRAP transporter substrate-binding protein [Devosia sp. Root635]|uniref:TRAP transporter substrate-binding protein n=1 Tax=Devosia sp. Root635 TaxID=1736575 RepID=UPI00070047FC|nr:TRAP transporter substrate-binding protein [Devosia sp. Root635]KRA47609.1 ABC transporter substrate-binding protein [Devosia sp. Root635]